mmetsp:Transcript_12875/g.36194  ORF Transcript_12875/g.36194 Transcript_12875/m.36194 type:complete len:1026 (+) Transcript_12875:189-3266(+)
MTLTRRRRTLTLFGGTVAPGADAGQHQIQASAGSGSKEKPQGPSTNKPCNVRYTVPMVVAFLMFLWAASVIALSHLPSDPRAVEISTSWDPKVYSGMMMATATQMAGQLVSYQTSPKCRELFIVAFAISTILLTMAFVLERGYSPLYLSYVGRVAAPVKYLSWTTTTTLLTYLNWLNSEARNASKLGIMLASNVSMLVFGWISQVATDRWTFIVGWVLSCLAEMLTWVYKFGIYCESNNCYTHLPQTRSALRSVYLLSGASWTSFPVVQFLADIHAISHSTEQLLWCLCDMGAKLIQSQALLQGVLCTMEDRASSAIQDMHEQVLLQNMMMKDREKNSTVHAAKVSHELRTPLNGIVGLTDALLMDPSMRADDEELVRSLQAVRNSGNRLNLIVNNLLDTAACGQDTLALEFGPVNLMDCLSEASVLLTPLLAANVELKTIIPPDLAPMRGDKDRMVQVFFNLLGNSVKFCRSAGTITLKGYTKGDQMVVEVSDTGPGIPADMLDIVFDPFVHSCNSPQQPASVSRSTGLGLALVKTLVDKHSGSVAVSSNPGILTTFTVTIPLWQAQDGNSSYVTAKALSHTPSAASVASEDADVMAAPDEGHAVPSEGCSSSATATASTDACPASSQEEKLPPGTPVAIGCSVPQMRQPRALSDAPESKSEILSIDDDPLNHMVLENIFKNSKFQYTRVGSGVDAVRLLTERKESGKELNLPAIVLMDSMMPEMDGVDTTRRIRSMFPKSLLPIIMISADATNEAMCAAFQAGCSQYVTKPVKRMDLMARVVSEVGITSKIMQHRALVGSDICNQAGQANAIASERHETMTVVVVSLNNLCGLQEIVPPSAMDLFLGNLLSSIREILGSSKHCEMCCIGDFYVFGVPAQKTSQGSSSAQLFQALSAACSVLRMSELFQIEIGVPVDVQLSIHASIINTVSLGGASASLFVGPAATEAMSVPRFPGCITVSRSVRDLLMAHRKAHSWRLREVQLPGGGPHDRIYLLQEGMGWMSAAESVTGAVRKDNGHEATSH